MNISLKTKMILITILIIIIILSGIVTISIISFQNSNTRIIKDNFSMLFNKLTNDIEITINNYEKSLKSLTRNPDIIEAVEKGNEFAIANDFITSDINKLENQFKPLGNTMSISSKAKNHFNTYIEIYPYFKEIFITNKYGHNVDVSNQTSDFVQSDEDWWKNAYDNGVYIEDVEYDDSAKSVVFAICISINDPKTNNVIGILKAAVAFSGIEMILEGSRIGETGEAYLINANQMMVTESRFIEELKNNNVVEETTKLQLKVDTDGASEAANGNEGFSFYQNYRNKLVAGHYGRILSEPTLNLIIETEYDEIFSETSNYIITLSIFSIIFLVLTIIIIVFLSTRITKPIIETTNMLKDISEGEGDLTKRLKIFSKDEIGEMAIYFNKFIENLNDIIIQVKSSMEQLNIGINQMADASQSLSEGASKQAASMEEITASINELSSQLQYNVDNIGQTFSLIDDTKTNSIEGNKMMKELVDSMEKINNSATDIKNIINVIDDIAFQTNLLALNADIEAERVGKYGKGFAVVASSVRTLAGKSAEAVKETTEKIEVVISNINKVNDFVKKTADKFEIISDGSINSTKYIKEVNETIQEQANSIEQISTSLGQIEEVIQNNSATAEENAASNEELATQTKSVKDLVSYFKVEKKILEKSFIDKDNKEEYSQELINVIEKYIREKDRKQLKPKDE